MVGLFLPYYMKLVFQADPFFTTAPWGIIMTMTEGGGPGAPEHRESSLDKLKGLVRRAAGRVSGGSGTLPEDHLDGPPAPRSEPLVAGRFSGMTFAQIHERMLRPGGNLLSRIEIPAEAYRAQEVIADSAIRAGLLIDIDGNLGRGFSEQHPLPRLLERLGDAGVDTPEVEGELKRDGRWRPEYEGLRDGYIHLCRELIGRELEEQRTGSEQPGLEGAFTLLAGRLAHRDLAEAVERWRASGEPERDEVERMLFPEREETARRVLPPSVVVETPRQTEGARRILRPEQASPTLPSEHRVESGSGSEGGGPRGRRPERHFSGRGFSDVQADLIDLMDHPDAEREKALKMERAVLLRGAKDAHLFDSIKSDVMEAQQFAPDVDSAQIMLDQIDAASMETEARSLSDWNNQWEGMLEEYKEVAKLRLELELRKARGLNDAETQRLEREVKLRTWGNPPSAPVTLARKQAGTRFGEMRLDQPVVLGGETRVGREFYDSPEQSKAVIVKALRMLGAAEEYSLRELKRFDEDPEHWKLLVKAMAQIPEGAGQQDAPTELQEYFSDRYPEGLHLKERLQIYIDARRHLFDRYIEVLRANGSLTGLGMGREDVPFEAIAYKLTDMSPADWWILIHANEMFPEIQAGSSEARELLSPVDTALNAWLDVERSYSTLPEYLLTREERAVLDKIFSREGDLNGYYETEDEGKQKPRKLHRREFWPEAKDVIKALGSGFLSPVELGVYVNIPTAKSALNSAEVNARLAQRVNGVLQSRLSSDLAQRLLSVWLTFPLMDRERASVQGRSEDRELMWSDRKRVYDYGEKAREPGCDWTIGRFFALPDQEFGIGEEDASANSELRRRRNMLLINSQRSVFLEDAGDPEGELVSDFLHQLIYVPDELKPGSSIRRKIISWVVARDGTIIDGGWRRIPFLLMGRASYGGYIGYSLSVAQRVIKETSSPSWEKPEQMESPHYWKEKSGLLDRLDVVSPWFSAASYEFRGVAIREYLLANGVNSPDVERIGGYSDDSDLEVIRDPGLRVGARNLIHRLTGNENLLKNLLGSVKSTHESYTDDQLQKIKMLHALGQLWPLSQDATAEYSQGFFRKTPVDFDQVKRIVKAIKVSGYLRGEYYEQFKREVWREMGFGVSTPLTRRKRYLLDAKGNIVAWISMYQKPKLARARAPRRHQQNP